jgi:hypothetical protein
MNLIVKIFLADIQHYNSGSGLREAFGDTTAQYASGACDDNNFVLDTESIFHIKFQTNLIYFQVANVQIFFVLTLKNQFFSPKESIKG